MRTLYSLEHFSSVQSLSHVQFFGTPWTTQTMEFSRPEYWIGLLFPSPGDLPNPGSNPGLPHCRQILYQLSHKGSPFTCYHNVTHQAPLSMEFSRQEYWSGSVSSVAQSCQTLCDPMDCSMPGFPIHHQLPELAQTHVHQVGDAIQPSHPLSSPSPPAFNLSQH